MELFKLRQSGPTCGDCTAAYDVVLLSKGITVKLFIENVLWENPGEWGRFSIGSNYFYPEACAWYRDGKMVEENHGLIPYYNKIITKVNAHGGWSNMDYMIEIEK